MLLDVPPETTVYHFRLVPDAVKESAGTPTHKFNGVTTVGAAGIGLTLKDAVCVQLFVFL